MLLYGKTKKRPLRARTKPKYKPAWLTVYESPASVEELQEFLKVVNEYKIAVWTFSRGKNLGYECS